MSSNYRGIRGRYSNRQKFLLFWYEYSNILRIIPEDIFTYTNTHQSLLNPPTMYSWINIDININWININIFKFALKSPSLERTGDYSDLASRWGWRGRGRRVASYCPRCSLQWWMGLTDWLGPAQCVESKLPINTNLRIPIQDWNHDIGVSRQLLLSTNTNI